MRWRPSRTCCSQPGGPRILTPHPGEFARLDRQEIGRRRRATRRPSNWPPAAAWWSCSKGHRTLVTDGRRRAINATGNPGMATGGTGDVLTGLITALLCQGLVAFDAARLGRASARLGRRPGRRETGPSVAGGPRLDRLPAPGVSAMRPIRIRPIGRASVRRCYPNDFPRIVSNLGSLNPRKVPMIAEYNRKSLVYGVPGLLLQIGGNIGVQFSNANSAQVSASLCHCGYQRDCNAK